MPHFGTRTPENVSRIENEAKTTHKLSSVVRDETHTYYVYRVYESAGLYSPSLCATYRCHREQGSSSKPYKNDVTTPEDSRTQGNMLITEDGPNR